MTDRVVTAHVCRISSEGYIAQFEVRVDVRTHGVECAGGSGAPLHGYVGGIYVKISNTFPVCVYYYRNGRVALHSKGFSSVKLPFRQPAPFFGHIYH